MKSLVKLILLLILVNLIIFSCKKSNTDDTLNPDFEYLKGTWIDKESFAMQFIDFYSESQARFGNYSKNFEKYDPFNYRIIESTKIAIDFLDDKDSHQTSHDLIRIGNDTIEISDLTDIPENPNKIYLRREILTNKKNDTIIIGHNQIYFDFESHFRLQIDSIINDSRCPIEANCIWTGNAEVRLDLIIEGNYRHVFVLNTNNDYKVDTIIDNIRYRLVGLLPYPKINLSIKQKDYKVKIMTEKQ
jgi:hypothetical protein